MSVEEKIVDGQKIRKIPTFPDYWITCHGYIWNEIEQYWIFGSVNKKTLYVTFCLKLKGKRFTKYAHQLVALCWIGPRPSDKPHVLHGPKMDERGAKDNHFSNLRYGTHKENMTQKITDNTARTGPSTRVYHSDPSLRERNKSILFHLNSGLSQVEVAAMFELSKATISRIKNSSLQFNG